MCSACFSALAALAKVTFFSAGQQRNAQVVLSRNLLSCRELSALENLCMWLSNLVAPSCPCAREVLGFPCLNKDLDGSDVAKFPSRVRGMTR
jgi:hypothetical protein